MTPIYCQQCNRANSLEAKRCIWCGAPIISQATPNWFQPTSVEIEYLDGIARLKDPAPVRLTISVEGIEVTELMPGSRSEKIEAGSIIEARVVDASAVVEGERVRPRWWWFAFGPLALAIPGKQQPDVKQHDYILTIKYRSGDEIHNAVFHRQDRSGLAVVEGLSRIISTLIQMRTSELERKPSNRTDDEF